MKKLAIPVISILLFLAVFKKMKISNTTALVVGDSHSAGFGWGWQDVLAKEYDFKVVNISKSGASIPQMFNAMKKFYASNSVPLVFIYGGANDIFNGTSVTETFSEMQEMVNYAKSKGSKVIVIAGFRSSKVSVGKSKSFITNYDLYKQKLPTLANAIVVPIWEGADKNDSPDGYHINAVGQKEFAQYIGNKILSN
jgi:lysophospholipase L1-like esterase